MEDNRELSDASSTGGGLLIDEPVAKILPVDEAVEQVSAKPFVKAVKRKALVSSEEEEGEGEDYGSETESVESESSDSEPDRILAPRQRKPRLATSTSARRSRAVSKAPVKRRQSVKPPVKRKKVSKTTTKKRVGGSTKRATSKNKGRGGGR